MTKFSGFEFRVQILNFKLETLNSKLMIMRDASWFKQICERNDFSISEEQLTLLDRYVQLLQSWNAKVNLISRKDEANIWEQHILHSISFLFFVKFPERARVLDLGTGGGLPGIPLKILLPSLKITLLDSTRKKVDAVTDMVTQLGLSEVETVWSRAEEIGKQEEFAGRFDYIVCRAVGELAELVKWAYPFLNQSSEGQGKGCLPSGKLLVLKGGNIDDESRKAKANKKVKAIDVINLVFAGSEMLENQDKKVVIIAF
jgi:16S rRNA (guanine527-N7)-methyltransferase